MVPPGRQDGARRVYCGVCVCVCVRACVCVCSGSCNQPCQCCYNPPVQEAVQREVLEESGYQFQPEALVAVQRMDRKRVRFGLAGSIIGGSLKTKEQADGESTQAAWFTTDTQQLVKELKLRNNSILPLIEAATEWFANRPYTGLPVAVGHVSSSQRLLIVQDIGQELKVLVSRIEGGTTRLPSCLIHRDTLFSRVDHNSTLDSAVKVSLVHRACGMFIL